MSGEHRKRARVEDDVLENKFSVCKVDGNVVRVSKEYKIEPSRLLTHVPESHPKYGRYQPQLRPEDIIINCGVNDPIPALPPNHTWKAVIHDPSVQWLCMWHDDVSESNVFVQYLQNDEHPTTTTTTTVKKLNRNDMLRRAVTVLTVCCGTHCPHDVWVEVINLYSYFDVFNAELSCTIQHPRFVRPLGVAIMEDRYLMICDYKADCVNIYDLQIELQQNDHDGFKVDGYVGQITPVNQPNFIATYGKYVGITGENATDTTNILSELSVYQMGDTPTSFEHTTLFTFSDEINGLLFVHEDQVVVVCSRSLVITTFSEGTFEPYPVPEEFHSMANLCDICRHPNNPKVVLVSNFGVDAIVAFSLESRQYLRTINVRHILRHLGEFPDSLGLNGICCLTTTQVGVVCTSGYQLLVLEGFTGEEEEEEVLSGTLIDWSKGITRLCMCGNALLVVRSN
eukprot:PhF_6_TR8457/c0_g1_i3/m.13206